MFELLNLELEMFKGVYCISVNFVCLFVRTVTECLTSDIFSMLLHVCGVSDCIIVFSIVLAP